MVQQRVMGMRDGAASAIYKGLQRLYAYSKRIKTESKNTPFHSYRFSKLRATSLPLAGLPYRFRLLFIPVVDACGLSLIVLACQPKFACDYVCAHDVVLAGVDVNIEPFWFCPERA